MRLTKAEQYRIRAQECEQRAERETDPLVRKQHLKAAQVWLELAEKAEAKRPRAAPSKSRGGKARPRDPGQSR